MTAPIPVVCDRCREQGLAGEDPFKAFGALLDFEPVPRRAKRADGWDAELQRAFIALLSLTGSVKAACRALGKSEFGITQILRSREAGSFAAAIDEAMAIAAGERSSRIAEAVRAAAAQKDARPSPSPPWAKAMTRQPAPVPAAPRRGPGRPGGIRTDWRGRDEDVPVLIDVLLRKYWLKLGEERAARLEGRIVAADFCVRQLSWIEVAIDLVGGGLMETFADLRVGRFDLAEVAATEASLLLDELRRAKWREAGEPERPQRLPSGYFRDRGGWYTQQEPDAPEDEATSEAREAARRETEARRAGEAEAHVRWEAQARAEAAAWAKRVAAEDEAAAAAAAPPASPARLAAPGGGEGPDEGRSGGEP
ncbi:MAG TPA: hypothetical protein VF702_10285 [Allosphingosinicella sp.]|jgi:hypothetical protein